jgi:hypothetical protein
MKINNVILKTVSAACIVAATLMFSCKEEERVNAEDVATLTEEAIADAYYEDADDVSSVTVYEVENPSSGRVSTNGRIQTDDGRLACATFTIAENSTVTSGQITIDFSDNQNGYCTFRGNRREGKIILTYSGGPRGNDNFTVVETFDGYKINGVELKGTRTIVRKATTPETNIKHEITLEGGEAIWPNGESITRESNFTRVWVRPPAEDLRVELSGSASGTTRRGAAYTMNITETMVYRKECIINDGIYMAVAGIKVFNSNGKQITVDYGEGACDRSIKISVNGISREVNVQ